MTIVKSFSKSRQHVIISCVHLHFRLKDSDLNISVEKASEVAKKTERELFYLYKDTDNKYKNKYRSLMFNLKDTKNNVSIKSGIILQCCFLVLHVKLIHTYIYNDAVLIVPFRFSLRKFSKGIYLLKTSFE